MRKLILIIMAMFITLSNFAYDECIKNQRFNAVVIGIPSVITIKQHEEYSVNVSKSSNVPPCTYVIKGDTLFIKTKYKNEDVQQLKHTETMIEINHPDPKGLFNNLSITGDYYMRESTKNKRRGNQN